MGSTTAACLSTIFSFLKNSHRIIVMGDRETRTAGGGPFGDLTIADVFESVVYWLPADRNALDALSHACTTTRRHLAHSPNFADAVFVCPQRCHVRCYTPRKRLAVLHVKFEALWRLRECIHEVQGLSLSEVRNRRRGARFIAFMLLHRGRTLYPRLPALD